MKKTKRAARTSKAAKGRQGLRKAKAARSAGRSRKRTPEMDHDAMMAAWQGAMTPGPGHQRLEAMVGSWTARTTFVMAPGAPPQTSDGTSENRWVLGGRYLEQAYKGMSMGMPFEGLGYTGFDNTRKRYVGTWMDTFGTGLMNSLGVGKPSAETMEFESEAHEPSGKKVQFRSMIRVQDRDHHTYEMWTKARNGRRFRSMLVEYTRR